MLNGNNVELEKQEKLIPYLSMHHERVFCYELIINSAKFWNKIISTKM